MSPLAIIMAIFATVVWLKPDRRLSDSGWLSVLVFLGAFIITFLIATGDIPR